MGSVALIGLSLVHSTRTFWLLLIGEHELVDNIFVG